jgi:cytochrome P450
VATTSPTESSAATGEGAADRTRARGTRELVRFLSNPLRYLDALRDEDGRDVVPFQLGKLPCHLVTKPELLKLAMHNEDWPPISRGRLMGLSKWYDTGLFLSFGSEHHRQRDQLWKPLFDEPTIPRLAVERTIRRSETWVENEPIEIYSELRSLCWSIDWEALTGTELTPDLLEALELGVEALAWLVLPFGPSRWSWPIPQSRKTRDAKRKLDALITRMIAERHASANGDAADAGARADLLTSLVRQAEADGVTTDDQIRATVKMWFGADQLHALFTWTLYLLAQNASEEAKRHAELDEVLGGQAPTPEVVPALTYTRKVLKEAMRVYPPVWGFFRQMTEDYKLGTEVIPKGHLMAMSPWVTHRDPRVWPDPLRFDPERWNEGAERPPELSYFPFSAGPYECHGKALAMKEAVLILATIGQRWSFRPVDRHEPQPYATWATEPKRGLRMAPVRRS